MLMTIFRISLSKTWAVGSLLLILAAISLPICGGCSRVRYNSQSATLITEAYELMMQDTAVEAPSSKLNKVVALYKDHPDDVELCRDAATALRMLSSLHMTNRYDYRIAHQELAEARRLAESVGYNYELAAIFLGISNLYNVNAGEDNRLHDLCWQYQTLALDKACRSHNERVICSVGVNSVYLSLQRDTVEPYSEVWRKVLSYKFADDNMEAPCMKELVRGGIAFGKHDYIEAETHFNRVLAACANGIMKSRPRLPYQVRGMLLSTYAASGNIEKAVEFNRENIKQSKEHGYIDYTIYYLSWMKWLYDLTAQKDSADKYYGEYLRAKDEATHQHGLGSVETMDMQSEIDRLNERIHNAAKESWILSILSAAGVICTALAIWVFLLHRKRAKQNAAGVKLTDAVDNSNAIPATTEPSKERDLDVSDLNRLKSLYQRIEKLMDESDEICRPGFVVTDLAALLHTPPRTVSQAIRVCHNSSFPQLLNEKRIQKAVDIMNSPDSERFTIQSISETVGFKSRTHFIANFKKLRGITPSDYWQQLRKNAKG